MSFSRDFAVWTGMCSLVISLMLYVRTRNLSRILNGIVDCIVGLFSIRLLLSISVVSAVWTAFYVIGQIFETGVTIVNGCELYILLNAFFFSMYFGHKKVRWRL